MAKISEQSIESAKQGNIVRAPVVNKKVRKNGKPAKTMEAIRETEPPNVADHVVRINNECDPVGFLSDIVNGKAIQCYVVEADGTIVEVYETPDLKTRVGVAKFLVERYIPKVGVIKHAHLHKMHKEQEEEENEGRTSFDQMVSHAAEASTSEE